MPGQQSDHAGCYGWISWHGLFYACCSLRGTPVSDIGNHEPESASSATSTLPKSRNESGWSLCAQCGDFDILRSDDGQHDNLVEYPCGRHDSGSGLRRCRRPVTSATAGSHGRLFNGPDRSGDADNGIGSVLHSGHAVLFARADLPDGSSRDSVGNSRRCICFSYCTSFMEHRNRSSHLPRSGSVHAAVHQCDECILALSGGCFEGNNCCHHHGHFHE